MSKLNKRVLLSLLAVVLFTSYYPLSVNADKIVSEAKAEISPIKIISGYTLQKPEKASEVDSTKFIGTDVKLTDIELTADQVKLVGSTTISNQTIPFSLKGKLYKHDIEGVLVGDLQDEYGNFEVDRFELENRSDKFGAFFNGNLPNEAFALYMTHKDTNSFLIVEDSVSDLTTLENFHDIFNASLEKADDKLLFWISSAFQPDTAAVKESGEDIQYRATHAAKTSAWTMETVYLLNYKPYKDKAGVKLWVWFPYDTNSLLTSKFEVNGVKMIVGDETFYNTQWKIGDGPTGGVLEMRVNANKPQAIKQTGIQYSMMTPLKTKFDINWSYSFYGVGAGVSFDGGKTVNSENFENHNAAGVTNVQKTKNAFMFKVGHNLQGSWDLDYYPHLGSAKDVNATLTLIFSAYNLENDTVYGPIKAYTTSPTPIVSK